MIFALLVSLATSAVAAAPSGLMSEQQRIVYEFSHPRVPEVPKDRAVLGPRTAPILIVAYSDFQCPYCRDGFRTVREVRKKYGDKVAFLFKHFPLAGHPLALPAAKRFEAIAMQSGEMAYRYHDAIFEGQKRLATEGVRFLDAAAKKLGVDLARMKKDMESKAVTERLAADETEARAMGFQGTPGFNVAGVTLRGAMPASLFETIIDYRLAPKASAGAGGGSAAAAEKADAEEAGAVTSDRKPSSPEK